MVQRRMVQRRMCCEVVWVRVFEGRRVGLRSVFITYTHYIYTYTSRTHTHTHV